MAHLERRIRKLEARFTDTTRLVPHSEEWFSYWASKLEKLSTGEDVDLRGMTLDVLDALRARDDRYLAEQL